MEIVFNYSKRILPISLTIVIFALSIILIAPYISEVSESDWSKSKIISYDSFNLDASGDIIMDGTVYACLLDNTVTVVMSGSFQVIDEDYNNTPFIFYPGDMNLLLLCGEFNGQDIEPRFAINSLDPFQEIILLLVHNDITKGYGSFFIKLSYEKGSIGEEESYFKIWLTDTSGKTFESTVNFGGVDL